MPMRRITSTMHLRASFEVRFLEFPTMLSSAWQACKVTPEPPLQRQDKWGEEWRRGDIARRRIDMIHAVYSYRCVRAGTAQKCGDATAERAQGAAWVGTAPVYNLTSVQSTMMRGEKAEFQKNHPSASGRIKVIVGCTKTGLPPPSETLDKTMANCRAGEVHARQWKTMYQTEICKLGK